MLLSLHGVSMRAQAIEMLSRKKNVDPEIICSRPWFPGEKETCGGRKGAGKNQGQGQGGLQRSARAAVKEQGDLGADGSASNFSLSALIASTGAKKHCGHLLR